MQITILQMMQRAQSLVITIREELLWQKKAKIMLYFNWLMKSQYDIYVLPPMPGTRNGLLLRIYSMNF